MCEALGSSPSTERQQQRNPSPHAQNNIVRYQPSLKVPCLPSSVMVSGLNAATWTQAELGSCLVSWFWDLFLVKGDLWTLTKITWNYKLFYEKNLYLFFFLFFKTGLMQSQAGHKLAIYLRMAMKSLLFIFCTHLHFILFWLLVLETGSHHLVLAGLGLTMQTRLATSLQKSSCLCLWSTSFAGLGHIT